MIRLIVVLSLSLSLSFILASDRRRVLCFVLFYDSVWVMCFSLSCFMDKVEDTLWVASIYLYFGAASELSVKFRAR